MHLGRFCFIIVLSDGFCLRVSGSGVWLGWMGWKRVVHIGGIMGFGGVDL